MSTFWQSFWLVIEIFLFMAYLIVFFQIISDLFRDTRLGGVAKALWVVVLMVLPILGALIYLIARGRGMDERRRDAQITAEKGVQDYIRQTANRNPAQEIAEARSLLDSGAITPAEFETLKAKALA
ncbi:SHOCT domain-containing protein [Actinomyces provencensis]|uniref:SHOCT domain-containing protein n=1 Tax=Actinomyces provencensis TaxID=1720198 RepID=UPI00096ABF81|nr:SHOCT domain-containing protein [Actinomyces provencensis]